MTSFINNHYVKSVQIRSFFWSGFSRIQTEYGEIHVFSLNAGKYGPEKAPYLDTFQAVNQKRSTIKSSRLLMFYKVAVPKNFAKFKGKHQC